MMKIRMLKTMQGAEDGITVKTYESGQEYSVGESLGNIFLDNCFAEAVVEQKSATAPSNKAEEHSETNKESEKEDRKDKAKKK